MITPEKTVFSSIKAKINIVKNENPAETELRDRIICQLNRQADSDTVALIWHGHITALLEWRLIEVNVFDRLNALLPRVGNKELYELSSGEPMTYKQKKELDEFLSQKIERG